MTPTPSTSTPAGPPQTAAGPLQTAAGPPQTAVNLRLFNSGLLDDGSPAPGGAADPHFTLISGPAGAKGTKAVAASSLARGYAPNTASSFWIGLDKNLSTGHPAGKYDYQTTVDLTGMDPATASITGKVAADDSVTILLNGVKKATIPSPAYGVLVPFTISGDFVPGINKLDFFVENGGGPTGLHLQLSGTATSQRPLGLSPEAPEYVVSWFNMTNGIQDYARWQKMFAGRSSDAPPFRRGRIWA
jgi:cyanobactin cluster PatC/TenC/TruC protein